MEKIGMNDEETDAIPTIPFSSLKSTCDHSKDLYEFTNTEYEFNLKIPNEKAFESTDDLKIDKRVPKNQYNLFNSIRNKTLKDVKYSIKISFINEDIKALLKSFLNKDPLFPPIKTLSSVDIINNEYIQLFEKYDTDWWIGRSVDENSPIGFVPSQLKINLIIEKIVKNNKLNYCKNKMNKLVQILTKNSVTSTNPTNTSKSKKLSQNTTLLFQTSIQQHNQQDNRVSRGSHGVSIHDTFTEVQNATCHKESLNNFIDFDQSEYNNSFVENNSSIKKMLKNLKFGQLLPDYQQSFEKNLSNKHYQSNLIINSSNQPSENIPNDFIRIDPLNSIENRKNQCYYVKYVIIPNVRPIVFIGPSLKGYEITDLMHKALIHHMKQKFSDKLVIFKSNKSINTNLEMLSVSIDEMVFREINQLKNICSGGNLVIVECNSVSYPSQLFGSIFCPLLIFLKITNTKILSRLIKSRGKTKVEDLSIQLATAEKLNISSHNIFDLVVDDYQLKDAQERLKSLMETYWISLQPIKDLNRTIRFDVESK